MKKHRGQNHARNTHEPFADDETEQRQPDGILDSISDNFAIQEVFELVNDDQKNEGAESDMGRDRESHRYNDAVADEIADNREKPAEESDYDQDKGSRNVRGEEENGGKSCIDR